MIEIYQQEELAKHIGQNLTYGIPLLDMYIGIEEHLNIRLDGRTDKINTKILKTSNVYNAVKDFLKIDPTPLCVGQLFQSDKQRINEMNQYIETSASLNHWILKNGLSHEVIQTIINDWEKVQATTHQNY